MTGVEWVVDARGCDPARLADRATLAACSTASSATFAHVVGEPAWHVFPGRAGSRACVCSSESHLAVHTFPEHGSLCLNLFCCRPRGDWDVEATTAAPRRRRATSTVRRLERSYAESQSRSCLR